MRSCIFSRFAAMAAIALLPVAAALQGCDHKELCYDHSHMTDLDVAFDWSDAPDAQPVTMVVHFFRPDGSLYKRLEFSSREGGKARLEAGAYMMLFHNGTMETVAEQGSTWDDHQLTCMASSLLAPMGRNSDDAPRPPEAGDQPVAAAPGMVWAGVHELMELKPKIQGQTVTLRPAEATAEYVVEIKNVENLSEGVDISAAISGMSSAYSLSGQHHCGAAATMPVGMEKVDEHTVRARFRAFGHCPAQEQSHIFSIYTSNKVFYHYDITGQIHQASDPRHVYIELDGLKIPDISGGMSPDISGWTEVIEKDLPMN